MQAFLTALRANPIDAIWLKPAWLNVWFVPVYEFALGLAVLALGFYLVKLLFPKVAAVAYTTAKESLVQPLFLLLVVLGAFFIIVLFPFLPYNTFGEDVKMVKDSGLTLIMLMGFFLAIWTASVSISDEIEGRTAVTLLSKPISRRHFVFGKLLGVILPVAILFLILGMFFLFSICFKVGYEARENGISELTDADRVRELTQVLPGLLLAFLEASVLGSISVAISTRLPMLPNLIISFAVYVLGHLVPVIVEATHKGQEIVAFVAKLLAVVLPNLDHFNIQTAVATGKVVPLDYLAGASLYALLYMSAMTVVGLLLFEDRDLA